MLFSFVWFSEIFPSSETQGVLVGMVRYFREKVYLKGRRLAAPGSPRMNMIFQVGFWIVIHPYIVAEQRSQNEKTKVD